MLVPQDETMPFQRDRQTVCGRPCQTGCGDQLGQRGRPGLQRIQDLDGFVEHADAGVDLVIRDYVVGGLGGLIRNLVSGVGSSHTLDYAISYFETQKFASPFRLHTRTGEAMWIPHG